jgi:phosphatidylserine/phosphatidylglycerophosphate/cardiolipin synthase-like enzyme
MVEQPLQIVSSLNQAKKSTLVQACSFTSTAIADALVRAHRRGVNVQLILDKSQKSQQHSAAGNLVTVGIPTFTDAAPAIAHRIHLDVSSVRFAFH